MLFSSLHVYSTSHGNVASDVNDVKILQAILDEGNYNIADLDRTALETVIQWLMESNNTEL